MKFLSVQKNVLFFKLSGLQVTCIFRNIPSVGRRGSLMAWVGLLEIALWLSGGPLVDGSIVLLW